MTSWQIVKNLFLAYLFEPQLIDQKFLKSHNKLKETKYIHWYTERLGEKIEVPENLLVGHPYESSIRANHESEKDKILTFTYGFVLAKDYVASLTDYAAEKMNAKLFFKSA